ncbi:MAG: S9 family peptidase [Thermomonas sp.]
MPRFRIVLFASLALALALAPVSAQVPLERYLKEDGYGRIKISPDGQHYAATVQLEDSVGLAILRRSDRKLVNGAAGVKDSVVADFWWANDNRLVIAMAERFGSRDQPYRTGQLFAIGLDGGRVKQLVGPKAQPGLVTVIGYAGPWEMTDLIDPLADDPDNVLISAWKLGSNPLTAVDLLDVNTGRRKRIATAPVNRATFLTDARGQVRFARGAQNDNASKLYYRDDNQSEWRLVNDEASTGQVDIPVGFSADGRIAYFNATLDDGPDALVAWNPATNERKQVLRDATVDPYAILHDRDGRTVLGVQFMSGRVHTRLLEPDAPASRTYRALENAFPDHAVNVTSHTRDGVALVQAWNDRTPGDTYLFDPAAMSASQVFIQREWFDPAKLPKARAITFKARDGLVLHGYLTLPVGAADASRLPMVVMPHGGPYGEFDEWDFNDDTQLLAEAGYAVLRINFRGSGNYGRAFLQAGAREWGGAMQDDLTDATRWAIAEKVADPARICIYGASYGGYAALMGVAKEPDLYRCAVGYVGVYDLEAMHREDSRNARWLRNWMDEWVGERKELADRTPIALASRIKAPVLLAAGGADLIAPISHSKAMARALRNAGKPVETLYFDSEGHGFYTEEHRRAFYVKLLDFLADHIGGARAAKGSGETTPGDT